MWKCEVYSIRKGFYFSVSCSACSVGNVQQVALESVICCSGDKLMCNGNDIGNLVRRKICSVIRFVWSYYHFAAIEFHGRFMELVI